MKETTVQHMQFPLYNPDVIRNTKGYSRKATALESTAYIHTLQSPVPGQILSLL